MMIPAHEDPADRLRASSRLSASRYVGARYAKLDRLFLDKTYTVAAHFAESGGIFTGAEVSYRGVTVGQVSGMNLTDKGVDVMLSIEKNYEDIPKDIEGGRRQPVGSG